MKCTHTSISSYYYVAVSIFCIIKSSSSNLWYKKKWGPCQYLLENGKKWGVYDSEQLGRRTSQLIGFPPNINVLIFKGSTWVGRIRLVFCLRMRRFLFSPQSVITKNHIFAFPQKVVKNSVLSSSHFQMYTYIFIALTQSQYEYEKDRFLLKIPPGCYCLE